MAFQEQIEKLVVKLTKLTEDGRVAWEPTADENTFLASVSKFVVTIGKFPSYEDVRDDYVFRIRSDEGRVIDEAEATGNPEWTRLGELYEMARRNALHVDEALSDILSSLEEMGERW